jgi:hypothetical protein
MAALPSKGNALVVARLYTDDPLNNSVDALSKETFYVSEESVQVESHKVSTLS